MSPPTTTPPTRARSHRDQVNRPWSWTSIVEHDHARRGGGNAQPPGMVVREVKIEIWSDIVCPFCYIGKRHLEAALADFEHADEVEVVWRSFELDPGAPPVVDEPIDEVLARKYGITVEQAAANQRRLEEKAATVGLEYHLSTTRGGNTFDAHRIVHLAAAHGLADAAEERLMHAYFTENQSVTERGTLVRLATEVGLDEAKVVEVLDGDAYADAVRADEAQAAAYGAQGVPFFVFGELVGVSGAQPVEVFGQALRQAWTAAHPVQMVGADGPVCDGDSCSLPSE